MSGDNKKEIGRTGTPFICVYGNYGVSNEYLTRDKEKPQKCGFFNLIIFESVSKTVLEYDFDDLRIFYQDLINDQVHKVLQDRFVDRGREV